MLRVGVDCGGTNTDAACWSPQGAPQGAVLGTCKVPTTDPVLDGVVQAVRGALEDARAGGRGAAGRCPLPRRLRAQALRPRRFPSAPPAAAPCDVGAVMLGTTTFVNACIQLRGLQPVAVVRLCGAATAALPPFCSLPPALRAAVGGAWFLASGGYEYDGARKIAPLDEAQLRAIARQILAAGLRCAVVAGVFSPVQPAQEAAAAAILREEAAAAAAAGPQPGGGSGGSPEPPLEVCLSHEVSGDLGLLERENAAILNAALLPLARAFVPACAAALAAAGVTAPLFFSSNDGTLLSAHAALKASWCRACSASAPQLPTPRVLISAPTCCFCRHPSPPFRAAPSTACGAPRC